MNYNGVAHLKKFLPSVLATQYENKQVVVADNGSTDESVQFIQSTFPEITLITHSKNEGFAGGYNWALKKISSDYYVLLNSDVEVDPNWLQPMVKLMESDLSIGACQPKLLAEGTRHIF